MRLGCIFMSLNSILDDTDRNKIKELNREEIAELLDSKWGYTYDDIEKGLNAIIEDHGAENIAVAKTENYSDNVKTEMGKMSKDIKYE